MRSIYGEGKTKTYHVVGGEFGIYPTFLLGACEGGHLRTWTYVLPPRWRVSHAPILHGVAITAARLLTPSHNTALHCGSIGPPSLTML